MATEHEDELDPRLADVISRLRDTPPAHDLWPTIKPRLERRVPRGSLVMRWPLALAAGIAIAIISVGGTMTLLRRNAPEAGAGTISADSPLPSVVMPAAFTPADSALAKAIADLEAAVRKQSAKLDPEARASIDRSLTALDQAIADAAAQRRAAPEDPHAAKYLTSTLRKKLQLLRTVSQLTAGET